MAKEFSLGFTVDSNELRSGLDRANSEVNRFVSSTTSAISNLSTNSEAAFAGVANAISAAFGGVAIAAAVRGIESVIHAVLQLSERSQEIRALATEIGLTVEQFQGLTTAANMSNISAETTTRAMGKLVEMLDRAKNNSGEDIKALRSIGLTLDEIKDPAFGASQMIQVIGKALTDSQSGTEVYQHLVDILKVRYASLALVLKDLQEKYGGVEGAAAKVGALNEEQNLMLTRIKAQWDLAATSVTNYFGRLVAGWALADIKGHERVLAQLYGTQVAGINAVTAATKNGALADDLANQNYLESRINAIQMELADAKQGTALRVKLAQELYDTQVALTGAESKEAVAAYKELAAAKMALNEQETAYAQRALDQQVENAKRAVDRMIAEDDRLLSEGIRIIDERESYAERAANEKIENEKRAITQMLDEDERLLAENIRNNRLLERDWDRTARSFAGTFSNFVTSVVTGTATVQQAFGRMVTGIIGDLVRWAVEAETKALIAIAISKIEGKSAAGTAAADSAKSAAAIPYIGWAIAPGAAAATFAAASGYLAEGGFDVPAGLSPQTQLHPREMVLPEHLADIIRSLDANGGGGGDVHLHVHALDSRDVERYVSNPNNRDAIARAVHSSYRGGGYANNLHPLGR